MTYGYIRVSTEKQDREHQKHEILEYANKNNIGHVEFVEETISSRKKLEDRDLSRLLNELKDGDILITGEVSRLGRSTMEVMEIFQRLLEIGVMVHIIKGGFIIGGKENQIQNSALIFAFSLSAKIERELISQRTIEALANRKAKGLKLGRPKGAKVKSKLDGKEKEIIALLDKKIPVSSIAKIFNVARSTMIHYIKTRNLDIRKSKDILFNESNSINGDLSDAENKKDTKI